MLVAFLAGAALAAAPTANLDQLLAKPTTQVRSQTRLAILLPKTLPNPGGGELYATGTGSRDRYEFRVTTTRDCSANYCFAASFSADKTSPLPRGGKSVKLAKQRSARFHAISCGASCAPATLHWKERGATYHIEAMVTRAQMIKLANEAIKKGRR